MIEISLFNFWVAIFIISINVITLYNLRKFAGKSLFKYLLDAISIFIAGIIFERILSIFYFLPINVIFDLIKMTSIFWIIGEFVLLWEIRKYIKSQ